MKSIIIMFLLITPSLSFAQRGFSYSSVECRGAYRKSDYVGFSVKKKLELKPRPGNMLPAPGEVNSFDVGEFRVHLNATESVSISVSHIKTKKPMYKVLYQTPKNLDNNHGLTGLHYISSPLTEGWMNLWCTLKYNRRR